MEPVLTNIHIIHTVCRFNLFFFFFFAYLQDESLMKDRVKKIVIKS